jgi:hypothetical protein
VTALEPELVKRAIVLEKHDLEPGAGTDGARVVLRNKLGVSVVLVLTDDLIENSQNADETVSKIVRSGVLDRLCECTVAASYGVTDKAEVFDPEA